MDRFLLNISYIGTNFRGIQKSVDKLVDPNLDYSSIQSCIDRALWKFQPKNEIKTILSSRTDAGVHALHSTLHVDLLRHSNTSYSASSLTSVLNRFFDRKKLPIRVLSTQKVPETFHCRYNAKARTYLYRFAVTNQDPATSKSEQNEYGCFIPIEECDRCCFLQAPKFDIERLKNGSRLFLGRHDFRTFMSSSRDKSSFRENPMFTVRHISDISIQPGKSLAIGANALEAERVYDYWNIEITGKSFIYKQVRRIVGSLFSLATERIDEKCIYNMLRVPSKNSWNTRIKLAPACGLYLKKVHYNPEDFES